MQLTSIKYVQQWPTHNAMVGQPSTVNTQCNGWTHSHTSRYVDNVTDNAAHRPRIPLQCRCCWGVRVNGQLHPHSLVGIGFWNKAIRQQQLPTGLLPVRRKNLLARCIRTVWAQHQCGAVPVKVACTVNVMVDQVRPGRQHLQRRLNTRRGVQAAKDGVYIQ